VGVSHLEASLANCVVVAETGGDGPEGGQADAFQD
jgi:hypothetical protein